MDCNNACEPDNKPSGGKKKRSAPKLSFSPECLLVDTRAGYVAGVIVQALSMQSRLASGERMTDCSNAVRYGRIRTRLAGRVDGLTRSSGRRAVCPVQERPSLPLLAPAQWLPPRGSSQSSFVLLRVRFCKYVYTLTLSIGGLRRADKFDNVYRDRRADIRHESILPHAGSLASV